MRKKGGKKTGRREMKGSIGVVLKLLTAYRLNVGALILLILLGVASEWVMRPFTKYVSTNWVIGEEKQETDSLLDSTYHYYLDISPSMYGFTNVNGSLTLLSQSFQELNRTKENLSFYRCGSQIETENEADFYDTMEGRGNLTTLYNQLTRVVGEDERTLPTMDLSNIFTDAYSDGSQFTNDSTVVNIIISDFNFRGSDRNADETNELMQSFSQALSGYAAGSNIGIYNIKSAYNGYRDDTYPSANSAVNTNDASFLVLVFSENGTVFNSYIEELEAALGAKGVNTSQKFELKTNLLNSSHDFEADPVIFHNTSWTTLNNFNYDSEYFKKIDDRALGLRIIKNNGNRASVQMPVVKMDLPGYYDSSQDNQTVVKTTAKIYDARLDGYKEYEGTGVLHSCKARMRQYDGEWYLSMDLEIDTDLSTYLNGKIKKYCVIDVLFSLDKPDFSIPAWVDEINAKETSELAPDYTKKLRINQLFEAIKQVKENSYESGTSSYQRQIGNIQLYINY